MKLRSARELSSKTQAQVAEASHISKTQYQNIEYGKCIPRVDVAILIAKALRTTVEEIF